MSKTNCRYHSFSTGDQRAPIPEALKNKDKRADPAALAAVTSAVQLIETVGALDLNTLNVLVLNREGCRSHLERVNSDIQNRVPAQGFFVRSGPQTLATYTSLALGAHGAAFTIVGNEDCLSEAIDFAACLPGSSLITVVKKNDAAGYSANTVLIEDSAENDDQQSDIPAWEAEVLAFLSAIYRS